MFKKPLIIPKKIYFSKIFEHSLSEFSRVFQYFPVLDDILLFSTKLNKI
jgi:hypothetical protein